MDPDKRQELVDEIATSSEADLRPRVDGKNRHDIELTLKEIQAVRLRAAGASYDEIAEALEYSNRSGAFKAVRRALQRWGSESVEELRILELQRLDEITKKLWPKVVGRPARDHGDGRIDPPQLPDMKAMDLYLRVSHRRSQLLGLDAPKMLDLVGAADEANQGDQTVAAVEEFRSIISELAQLQVDDDTDPNEAGAGEPGDDEGSPAAGHPVLPAQSER